MFKNITWARSRKAKGTVKLHHTLIDLKGNIPALIHISDSKLQDMNVFNELIPEPEAFTLWNVVI